VAPGSRRAAINSRVHAGRGGTHIKVNPSATEIVPAGRMLMSISGKVDPVVRSVAATDIAEGPVEGLRDFQALPFYGLCFGTVRLRNFALCIALATSANDAN
jgi:hypothetical protein